MPAVPGGGAVRWVIDGREHCKSFKARSLADGFLDGLKDAVRTGGPSTPAPACQKAGPPKAR